ncbi:type 1 glutamine amidotransferase [Sediminivirga luteola]|uniref:type 1 glutamine amidotransferase n=1 Tax=Sediminivirga luteola TaxID=1774748 RepID=UPI001F59355E|nr:type 1 glutamine amidotransferase [Sediminivirga luteola]MCI2264960.1 type 1 glutamine amidotransferase [Sediminivirga luteola]
MVRILVIQHEDGADARRFGDWLVEAGAELEVLRPDRGDAVPADLDGYDGLVVLGGSSGPEDDETHPWLPATRALQRLASETQAPSFNICLGAQLAAVAHETRVFRRSRPQVGIMEVRRRAEAAEDPVFSVVPERAKAVLWHQEEIAAVPQGAVHLMDGTDAPVQAFRVGACSWATQFHPEPDEEIVRLWAEQTSLTTQAGRQAQEVVEEYLAQADEIEASFRPVAAAFVEYIRQQPSRR